MMANNYIVDTDILKLHLEKSGLNRNQLAVDSATDYAQLNRILRGSTKRPRVDTIMRICDALNIQQYNTVMTIEVIEKLTDFGVNAGDVGYTGGLPTQDPPICQCIRDMQVPDYRYCSKCGLPKF